MYDGLHFELDERKYQLGKTLGSGSYGVVVKALDKLSKQYVAVKQVPQLFEDTETMKKIMREIRILHGIRNCEYIMTLLDVELSSTSIYMVTELCDSDLNAYIQSDTLLAKLDNTSKIKIMYQTMNALAYMHAVGVLHRDIKPANILLDSKYNARVCDFGLARIAHNCDFFIEQGKPDLTEYVVSRWYRAPEIVLVPGRYGKAQDIWSAGCTFVEMYKRSPLFPGTSVVHQLHVIVDVLGQPNDEDLEFNMSDRSRRYMQSMLSMQIGLDRASAGGEMIHKDLPALLRSMLQFNPNRRVTAMDAIKYPLFDSVRKPATDDIIGLTGDIIIDTNPIDACESTAEAEVNLLKTMVRDIRAELRKEQMMIRKAKSISMEGAVTAVLVANSLTSIAQAAATANAPAAPEVNEDEGDPHGTKKLDDLLPKRAGPIVQRVIQRRRSALNLDSVKEDKTAVEERPTEGTVVGKDVVPPPRPGVRRTISNVQSAVTLTVLAAIGNSIGGDFKPRPPAAMPRPSNTMQASNPDSAPEAAKEPITLTVLAKGRTVGPAERHRRGSIGALTIRKPNGKLEVVMEENPAPKNKPKITGQGSQRNLLKGSAPPRQISRRSSMGQEKMSDTANGNGSSGSGSIGGKNSPAGVKRTTTNTTSLTINIPSNNGSGSVKNPFANTSAAASSKGKASPLPAVRELIKSPNPVSSPTNGGDMGGMTSPKPEIPKGARGLSPAPNRAAVLQKAASKGAP